MKPGHIDNLISRLPALAVCHADIQVTFEAMRDAYKAKGKVLICGNGGSASDAEHWAAELLKGFRQKRPLSFLERANLSPRVGAQLQGALPILPLTCFSALSTAFANDVAPELTFAQLVWGLGTAKDVFIGISTSGNARNVCAAAQVARARGLVTVALSGENGGDLKSLCDLNICVPAHETYLVQEYHLPIYHCLSMMLEDEFFSM